MPFEVTQEDILSVKADAAVICIENTMIASADPSSMRIAEVGGKPLEDELKKQKFLSVGRARSFDPCGLPYKRIIATGAPRWMWGEGNELVVLRKCYESIFRIMEEEGLHSVVTPFLSASYYPFPREEAVRVAMEEVRLHSEKVIFVAHTPELAELGMKPYRKPQITEYVGYYRDHAVFRLDNEQFAKIDIRVEMRNVEIRPYIEACYYMEADPSMLPLPQSEIDRLRRIYDEM